MKNLVNDLSHHSGSTFIQKSLVHLKVDNKKKLFNKHKMFKTKLMLEMRLYFDSKKDCLRHPIFL